MSSAIDTARTEPCPARVLTSGGLMTRKSVITTFCLAVVLAVAYSAGLAGKSHLSSHSHASWVDVYGEAQDMAHHVDEVVIARAQAVTPGRVAYSDDGQDSVSFDNITFTVERSFKNQAEPGTSITIERIASNVDFDGGPYLIGDTYALFLRKQEATGRYYLVNDQGRFKISGGVLVGVKPHDPVADVFDGLTRADFVSSLQRLLGRN